MQPSTIELILIAAGAAGAIVTAIATTGHWTHLMKSNRTTVHWTLREHQLTSMTPELLQVDFDIHAPTRARVGMVEVRATEPPDSIVVNHVTGVEARDGDHQMGPVFSFDGRQGTEVAPGESASLSMFWFLPGPWREFSSFRMAFTVRVSKREIRKTIVQLHARNTEVIASNAS